VPARADAPAAADEGVRRRARGGRAPQFLKSLHSPGRNGGIIKIFGGICGRDVALVSEAKILLMKHRLPRSASHHEKTSGVPEVMFRPARR